MDMHVLKDVLLTEAAQNDSADSHESFLSEDEIACSAVSLCLSKVEGSAFDIAALLYELILVAPKEAQAQVFEAVCRQFGNTLNNGTFNLDHSQYYPERDALQETYGEAVDGILQAYQSQNLSEGQFYAKLWDALSSDLVFDSEAKRVFALYYILVDIRIPYFSLGPRHYYSISDKHFEEMMNRHKSDVQRLTFVRYQKYDLRSDAACAVLQEFGIHPPSDEVTDLDTIVEYERQLMLMDSLLSIERKVLSLLQAQSQLSGGSEE